MNTKAILASTLLTALIAGTSANAEGRAGYINDNVKAEPSVKIVKVSVKTPAPSLEKEINR